MSDVTQADVIRLAEAIENFSDNVDTKIGNLDNTISDELAKYYTVNHEPKVELPFEELYEYRKTQIIANGTNLGQRSHIFIEGYLKNGDKIDTSNLGTNYGKIFINGVEYTTDYIARLEEGAVEKIDILIAQMPYDDVLMIEGNFVLSWNECPLYNFNFFLNQDINHGTKPDINDFLGNDIKELYIRGAYVWTFSGICRMRKMKTYDPIILGGGTTSINAPLINVIDNRGTSEWLPYSSYNQVEEFNFDNITGRITSNISFGSVLKDRNIHLKISGMNVAFFNYQNFNTLDIGDFCVSSSEGGPRDLFTGLTVDTLILGKLFNVLPIYFATSAQINKVIFRNINPLNATYAGVFYAIKNLSTIEYSYLGSVGASIFPSSLQNATFIPLSIEINLPMQNCASLSEDSGVQTINAIKNGTAHTVSVHASIRSHMITDWYVKPVSNGIYEKCSSTDEGAITQEEAIIAKGWTLA